VLFFISTNKNTYLYYNSNSTKNICEHKKSSIHFYCNSKEKNEKEKKNEDESEGRACKKVGKLLQRKEYVAWRYFVDGAFL
jgi:hypothetical protein